MLFKKATRIVGLMGLGAALAGVRHSGAHQGKIGAGIPDLGAGASLHGKRVFPADNIWNQDISKLPTDPRSDVLIAGIGMDKPLHPDFGTVYKGNPNGIPYLVLSGEQAKKRLPVIFRYADESDPGPYPIPLDAPIEGGPKADGDRHVLILDRDHWLLYELWSATPQVGGWHAGSGAIFDLNSNKERPLGWTSADAAGLPVFPGLVRYDEAVEARAIQHALRFTCVRSRRAFVAPARHFASSHREENLPPMGMRVRLKASVDIRSFPPTTQVVLKALQRYGMILADNGSDWFVSGAPDPRWKDEELNTLKRLKGRDFEVVQMGPMTTK